MHWSSSICMGRHILRGEKLHFEADCGSGTLAASWEGKPSSSRARSTRSSCTYHAEEVGVPCLHCPFSCLRQGLSGCLARIANALTVQLPAVTLFLAMRGWLCHLFEWQNPQLSGALPLMARASDMRIVVKSSRGVETWTTLTRW